MAVPLFVKHPWSMDLTSSLTSAHVMRPNNLTTFLGRCRPGSFILELAGVTRHVHLNLAFFHNGYTKIPVFERIVVIQ